MLERALAIDPDDNNGRYNAACTYALLGESESAIELLQIWSKNVGPEQQNWFKHDADLISLHDHPRYASLLAATE